MISGSIQWVVVQRDDDTDIVAIWGPFGNEQEAIAWQGIPGHNGTYQTHQMRSAPQWFEELKIDEENS